METNPKIKIVFAENLVKKETTELEKSILVQLLKKLLFFPYLFTAITFVWCFDWISSSERGRIGSFIYHELLCPGVGSPKKSQSFSSVLNKDPVKARKAA